MANVTIDQFTARLKNLETCIEKEKKKIQFSALNTANGLMHKRIFNQGLSSDGTALGVYRSKQWKKTRENKPRQTAYKDLFFNGDLSRSLTVGENNGDFVLGLSTDKARLIMEGQESQTRKTISEITKETEDKVIEIANEMIAECISSIFNR